MNKNLVRSLSVFLCFLFLFVPFFNPLTVSASAIAGSVDIGLIYNDVVSVAPELVPFALVLIAAGYTFNNTDELINKAQELSDKMKPTTIEWAKKFASSLESGGQVVAKFSSSVLDDIKSGFSSLFNDVKDIPIEFTYLVCPGIGVLSNLGALTQADLLAQDSAGLISVGNTIAQKTLNKLETVRLVIYNGINEFKTLSSSLNKNIVNKITSFYHLVEGKLLSIRGHIADIYRLCEAKFVSIGGDLADIYRLCEGKLVSIRGDLADIYRLLEGKLVNVNWYLADIPRKLEGKLIDIRSYLKQINDVSWLKDVKTSLSTGFSNLTSSFDDAINNIKNFFNPPPDVKPDTSIGNEFDDDVDGAIGSATGSFGFIEDAFSKLTDWSAGFLVVGYFINMLTQVSFINYLINFSLALGLLALSLNLFGSILSSTKPNSSARNTAKTPNAGKKGG